MTDEISIRKLLHCEFQGGYIFPFEYNHLLQVNVPTIFYEDIKTKEHCSKLTDMYDENGERTFDCKKFEIHNAYIDPSVISNKVVRLVKKE
jgi:hypothetical protein